VSWDDRDGVRWIHVRGELDNAGYQRVSARFYEAARGADQLVINLADVPFVSSNGVRLLLAAHHQLKGRGGRVRVTGLQAPVRRVLETIRIFEAIPELGSDLDDTDGADATSA